MFKRYIIIRIDVLAAFAALNEGENLG